MSAYYNEIEPYPARWLRNLVKAGLIADGEVDERSIVDVRGDDLRGFVQCHFFAGIGIWSHALRLAGWPDYREVWTGSCPCQPFSAAGRASGFGDGRHLWPHWSRLIGECRPGVIFGEQVASRDGLAWLDFVCADLEAADYAVGAIDTCAAGFGAPHIRQRLYFVADAGSERRQQIGRSAPCDEEAYGRARWNGSEQNRDHVASCNGEARALADAEHAERRSVNRPEQDERDGDDAGRAQTHGIPRACGEVRGVAHPNGRDTSTEGIQRGGEHGQQPQDGGTGRVADAAEPRSERTRKHDGRPPPLSTRSAECGATGDMGDTSGKRLAQQRSWRGTSSGQTGTDAGQAAIRAGAPTNGFWYDADWLPCIDGKARPTQSGLQPLAHGAPARVGRLRAYGNAIVAPQASEFIAVAMECLP